MYILILGPSMGVKFHVLSLFYLGEYGVCSVASRNYRAHSIGQGPRDVGKEKECLLSAKIRQKRRLEDIAENVSRCAKRYVFIAEAFEDSANVKYSWRAVVMRGW